ncbi:MAG TPA: cytochrome c3 family protein [Nitrospirota bacterium]|nr:cytochrome c3 family protein [Nitrospirota bacterium]
MSMKKAYALVAVLCLVLSVGTALGDVGGGDLTYNPPNAKPVLFSHAIHVDNKTYKCSACHNHTFQMSKDSYKMDMSKINKGQFCGICHNGERSFDVKDKASCVRCHK